MHEGEIQLEWYLDGYSHDRLTQSQSMHKSLQALLVGIAIDQQLIRSIDDPVGNYLPLLAGEEKGTTTMRDYLRITSGLQPFDGGFSPFGQAFRWLYAEDIATATIDIPKLNEAGATFEYHDVNTQIIGMLLTEVFG